MAITAVLFFCLSLYLALLKRGKKKAENRATERLKYCDSVEKERAAASKKSRTQDEYSVAQKLQRVQQQPCSEPDLGVGSSSNFECSSSSNKKFEVFISHRGPDTKRTLAYHMYDLLRDRGIKAFLDKEELQSGDSFPLAIEEAIACSKVDVCILSSGYAESVWCLKELRIMVDKYQMGKSKLIPIFYDVKPWEVRYLQGAFGQGFQEKIIDKNRYSTQLIDQWRQALSKIADIEGEEGKGERCTAIVNKIFQELDAGLLAIPSNVVGRQEELLSVKHAIMKCSENGCGVTSVEISGIGGIGKTTFAKQLYNQIGPRQYERCCFIEDVGGLVEKYGVNEIHKQLISKLLKYEPRNMRMEGKKLLIDRLQNAEILVVLDNIHSKIPLSTVFIDDDVCLNSRSIIIVTSREKAILKSDPRVARYCQNMISLEISHLDFHTSNELFCRYAFGGIGNVRNEFNELIKQFVTKCQGIPLVLTLLGSQVYGREIKFWKILWNSIKDSLHPDLQKILIISYNNLDSGLEKCLFLDVATFMLWEKEDLLVQLRRRDDEDGDSEILYALDKLKMKNLIKVVDGVLMMHDLLVDLGRSIVKEEDPCPSCRSRVWHPSDVRHMLSNKMGSKKVKALNLVSRGLAVLDEDGCPWPADAFKTLLSLEFLILQGYCIQGDLSKLPKKLLWLKWIDFPYECIAPTLCLKSIKALHVSGERLNQLWEHRSEEEAPINIRQLCLSNCMNLKSLPEFTAKFRHLSCIELRKCTFLEIIPDSFGNLRSLCNLKIMDCYRIKSLPESFGKLSQLQKLEFNRCPALERLPESFGELLQLEKLEFNRCPALERLPESFGELLQLEILTLSGCKALQCLPKSFGRLRQLQDLQISYCHDVKVPPKLFGCLTNLLKVKVKGCDNIRFSAEQFQWLQCIHHLDISTRIACSSSGQIAEAEQQNIDGWKNSKWHGQASQQQHLTSLVRKVGQGDADFLSDNNQHAPAQLSEVELIAHCFLEPHGVAIDLPQQMHKLAQSVGNLRHLKSLELSHCANLRWLPQSVCNLRHLKTLSLHNCVNLQWLIDSAIGSLSSLKILKLGLCSNLKVLPASIGNLPHLRELTLKCFWSLEELPASIGNLPHLRDLSLKCLWSLEELPDTIGNLQNLTKLKIHDCIVLKGLPSRLGNLSSLKCLVVSNCWMVEVINMQGLLRLETLKVSGCVKLRSIVGLSGFRNLSCLKINGCLNLTHMPGIGSCTSFNSLQDLSINGCYQFYLPNEGLVEHLPNELHNLTLSLNHDSVIASLDKETKTLPNILQWSSHVKVSRIRELNAKTSPVLFSAVEKRVRDLLSTENDSFYSFHKISLNKSVPFVQSKNKECAAVLCLVSAVYSLDLPLHVPLPRTTFDFVGKNGHIFSLDWLFFDVNRFDFGEQVHLVTLNSSNLYVNGGEFVIWKWVDRSYPSYEAFVKEGWLIILDAGEKRQNELLAAEICNIFTSELMKQRWLSRAWTQLPSQLCISEFSALDIAGCQITKISRHCNTFIMEEESGLTWKRRRCFFKDDHALLLEQPRRNSSEHSFLAYPGLHLDLEAGILANLYEMSISMLIKGKLIHSRKLQEIVSINEQEIPVALNTLLQTNSSHSTLKTLHRQKMKKLHNRPASFRFE